MEEKFWAIHYKGFLPSKGHQSILNIRFFQVIWDLPLIDK